MTRKSGKLLFAALIGAVCATAAAPSVWGTEEARTTGKIFIGPAGIYVGFFSGEQTVLPKAIVPFITGVEPRDLTQQEAEANPIQMLSIEADDAWQRCLEAREKAKKQEISEEEANLVCTEASEKSAMLDMFIAKTMLANPFSDRQEWEDKLFMAEQDLLATAQEPAGFEAFTDVLERDLTGDPQTLVPVETAWETLPLVQPTASPTGATVESGG